MITTKVLGPSLWPAVESFFLAEKCSGCWCMNHRLKPGVSLEGEPARQAFADGIKERQISGIIAFDGDQPIGWCAFDRIADLPGLDCGYPVAARQQNDNWSIHCLSVLAGYPKDAVFEQMIAAATEAMKRESAKLAEGYPPPALPSDNSFSGTIANFERQGFRLKGEVNRHYTRMVKPLGTPEIAFAPTNCTSSES